MHESFLLIFDLHVLHQDLDLSIENPPGVVEATVNVASAITTSHTDVQLFQHDLDIVYYCFLLFIHAHV